MRNEEDSSDSGEVGLADFCGSAGSASGFRVARGAQISARSARAGDVQPGDRKHREVVGNGKGFQFAVWERHRTLSMADAGVSAVGGRHLPRVRSFHARIVFRSSFSQCVVFLRRLRCGFLCGQARCGDPCRKRGRVAVGSVSQCSYVSFRMGMGHIARSAAQRNALVGDPGTCGIEALARLVSVRTAVGLHADDQPVAGFAAAVFAGMGSVPSVPSRSRGARNKISPNET